MKKIVLNNEQQRAELHRRIMKVSSLVHTIVCSGNDIAHSKMLDAIERLKDEGMFVRNVKYYANEAIRRYERFERVRKADTGHREQLHINYLDYATEAIESDLRNLHFSIKHFLNRRKETQTDIKTYVISAEAMLYTSVRLFDSLMTSVRKQYGFDFTPFFIEARLDSTLSSWKNVSEAVAGQDILQTGDKLINLAIDVIANRLSDPQFIDKCGCKAIMLDEKLMDEFGKEMK